MTKSKFALSVLLAVFVLLICGFNAHAGEAAKVNINTASVDELAQLKGIGPSYAAKIVEYREQNGPFAAPEDLLKVNGIGQKTFDKNKELIVVE